MKNNCEKWTEKLFLDRLFKLVFEQIFSPVNSSQLFDSVDDRKQFEFNDITMFFLRSLLYVEFVRYLRLYFFLYLQHFLLKKLCFAMNQIFYFKGIVSPGGIR